MATNTILEVAQEATNILTDSEYAADDSILDGVLNGATAESELYNKTTKQVSLCSAGLSQFVADNQATDIDDSLTVVEYATALQDAIDARVVVNVDDIIVTQPQFDNSTHAATTAWVNRALGSYSGDNIITVDDDVELDVTAIGKVIVYDPAITGQITITLPDYNTSVSGNPVLTGSTITILSTVSDGNSAGVDVEAYAGNNILLSNGSDTDRVGLFAGSSVVFTYINNTDTSTKYWLVTGGTRQLKDSYEFKGYLNTNGYQYFPNGLLMQWGKVDNMSGDDVRFVSYPIPFKSHVYNLQATVESDTPSGGSAVAYAQAVSLSQCEITLDTISGSEIRNVYWIAMGN